MPKKQKPAPLQKEQTQRVDGDLAPITDRDQMGLEPKLQEHKRLRKRYQLHRLEKSYAMVTNLKDHEINPSRE